ncbi:MAG: M20/M25/M40 family metallo-hydrolase [Ardenticatenales bacterium]|nr:M20/M25/M40 family metallo-hydrolase [Ardenticatenales bacterium]
MTPLINLVRQLVAINSINPAMNSGPGEAEVAQWATSWLRARGIDCKLQEAAPGRPNVIARVVGRGEAPALLLNAHLDTVAVEGMDTPFILRVEGDRLYGRGAYDMKGSAAIMLSLAEHFVASPPPGDIWLTLVSDEEDFSIGSDAIVRDWLPTLQSQPTAALVLEPTEEGIGIAHKGFGWYEMEVRGRAAHGSLPDEGLDAIAPLGAVLGTLLALEKQFAAGPTHPLLGRPSLHASVISGGSGWSVYPAEAQLRWERRTLPSESQSDLQAEMERVLAAARTVNGADVTGHCAFARDPLGTSSEAPLVSALQRAVPEAPLVGLPFWTDGALFSAAGLSTVIYGPMGHGAHAIDEWVSLSSLERVREAVRQVIEAGAF